MEVGWFIDGFPKTFGNPVQRRIDDTKTLSFLLELNRYTDCYLSVNYYPNWMTQSSRHIQFVTVPKLFFDFDSVDLNLAYKDMKKLYLYLDGEVPTVPVFSGNKGFHLYILLKPKTYEVSAKLKELLYRSHKYFETKLGLKTLDQHVYSDYKRIARIPYTKNSKSGLWSFVLDDVDVPLNSVLDQAKERPPAIQIPNKERNFTLDEFVEKYKYDVMDKFSVPPLRTETIGELADLKYYESLFEYYPCVWNDLLSDNPKHVSRFQAVVWMKWLGFSMQDIVEFFNMMSERFKWIDRQNIDVRNYQIYQIYTQIPEYKPYGCKTFKENGICIKCKRYIPMEEYE